MEGVCSALALYQGNYCTHLPLSTKCLYLHPSSPSLTFCPKTVVEFIYCLYCIWAQTRAEDQIRLWRSLTFIPFKFFLLLCPNSSKDGPLPCPHFPNTKLRAKQIMCVFLPFSARSSLLPCSHRQPENVLKTLMERQDT